MSIKSGSDDEFDAMVNSEPAPVREKVGRRAATKVRTFYYSRTER